MAPSSIRIPSSATRDNKAEALTAGPALWSSSATCRWRGSLQPVAREGGRVGETPNFG